VLPIWRETQTRKHGPGIPALLLAIALLLVVGSVHAQEAPRNLLVRHGETTADGTRDPELSEAGRARAERLAQTLASAGVTRVLSTDYKRTQGTAAPLARAAGVAIESYDPSDLTGLAEKLRTASGVIVVVGHSNTTPDVVRALGGDAGAAIGEHEHDRLYVVVPGRNGAASATVLLRY
jgi:broad specificity phosphatase PhoE